MTTGLVDGLDAIGRHVEDEVEAGRMTGAAISVAENGVILWESGFGFADVAAGRRASEHTPFALASVTKPFTASAVMTLVQAGKLVLDRPIGDYLVEPLPQSGFDSAAITLRRLGGHAAGLPTLFGMTREDGGEISFTESVRDYARMVYPAGERYEYSNIGYNLLGEAASNVAGVDFGSVMRTAIIEPMGLANAFYKPGGYRAGAATGYDAHRRAIALYGTATPPSGELYASAHDLSIFASHMMATPGAGRRRILNDGMLEAMFATVYQGGGDAFTTFGWEGAHVDGERVIVKRGGQPGVATRLTMMSDRKISIAVVANRTDNAALVERISADIAALFVPGWSSPELEPVDAIGNSTRDWKWYRGEWAGTISNGEIAGELRLEIDDEASRWAITDGDSRLIETIDHRHDALRFDSNGVMPGRITCEQILSFKLVARGDCLVGRCLAMVGDKPLVSMLPYLVSLTRV